jgi:hypothetical protein
MLTVNRSNCLKCYSVSHIFLSGYYFEVGVLQIWGIFRGITSHGYYGVYRSELPALGCLETDWVV